MQNVPEIGVTVMVARAQDESELPEIQSIVQANGQSDVVPGEWTANTHVGSNYSTSYSDSVGIRFGAYMSYDLNYAIKLLENKYETGGGKAAGERFKDVSYSKGGGYSFSAAEAFGTSPSDETALYGPYGPGDNTKMLSASESFGSNYSRRYSPVSSDHSTIDISYSFSTIGQTESYTTVTGFSYSQIHNMGTVTNISVTDGVTTNTSTNNADVINTNTINANSTNTSTTTGETNNTTTNNGKVTNTSVTDGVTTNTSTNNADVINTNTINANSTNTSTTTGDTTSTTTNNGKVTTTTTTDGATSNTSTNNADVTNTNTINASSTNTTTVTGTNKSITHVGVQTDSSMVGLSNSNRLVGASFDFGVTGLQQSVTAAASATSVSIQGNGNSVNIVGANTEVRIWGVGTAFLSRGAQAAVNLPLSEITLPTIIKMIL
ncbi:MAG: hypothetical protein JNM52_02845, partial [Betaproteobacteria bacterium]|nr:hypothetical protein [Betaproteobacteria bacterium]